MKISFVEEMIRELGVRLPDEEWFTEIGNLTALRLSGPDGALTSNYARGPLLYSIVASYRPATVLEFGTGRGFGAICMARAMADHGIDGRIVTVDTVHEDERFEWTIDRGAGPTIEKLSISDVWNEHIDQEWRGLITKLSCKTTDIPQAWQAGEFPQPSFGYIDAGHRYEEVRHDFYTFLTLCDSDFAVLMDDYNSKPGFGVKRFVDGEIAPLFDTRLVATREAGALSASDSRPGEGMVFIDSRQVSGNWIESLPPELLQRRHSEARRELRTLEWKDSVKVPLRFALRALRLRS